MALTVAESRRKYLKYLIQASAAVLVSPWATPTYAEEAEDDEEEEPVVEKPKPKVLASLVQVHRPAMLCRKGACKMNEYRNDTGSVQLQALTCIIMTRIIMTHVHATSCG